MRHRGPATHLRATETCVKTWWHKWSYEIPLAIGDGLWEVCVVQFADFLSRLTLRQVLEFIVLAVLVTALVQTLPIDLALLVAGDVVTYLELTALVWLIAGRDNVLAAARFARELGAALVRTVSRRVPARWREPRIRSRPPAPGEVSDDDGAPVGVLCAA